MRTVVAPLFACFPLRLAMSDTISEPAILIPTVSLHFLPMPLLKRAAPFDDPDWIYELKMDGFRALAIVEHGRAQLLSRNGHPFASFSALAESISDSLPSARAVIDG